MKASARELAPGRRVKVWDPLVRVGHWLLVAGFFITWFSEDDLETVHAWAGYVVGAVVIVRVVWGFAGTRHARFTDFVFGAAKVTGYAKAMFTRHPVHYLGHNPLGGWMVVALLVMLSLTVWTGLELYAVEGKGPLAATSGPVATAMANGDRKRSRVGKEEFWEDLHEFSANFTMFLVVLHILGVLFSSLIHRENLVRGMISGYKRQPDD